MALITLDLADVTVHHRLVRLIAAVLLALLVGGCGDTQGTPDTSNQFCLSVQGALTRIGGEIDESRILTALDSMVFEGLSAADRDAATAARQSFERDVRLHFSGQSFNGFTTKAIVDVANRICDTKLGVAVLIP